MSLATDRQELSAGRNSSRQKQNSSLPETLTINRASREKRRTESTILVIALVGIFESFIVHDQRVPRMTVMWTMEATFCLKS